MEAGRSCREETTCASREKERQPATTTMRVGRRTSCSMLADSFLSVPASLPERRDEVRSHADEACPSSVRPSPLETNAHDQAVRVPLATQEPRSTPRSERAVLRLGWGVSSPASPRASFPPVPS